jgi:hypothetical protein
MNRLICLLKGLRFGEPEEPSGGGDWKAVDLRKEKKVAG